MRCVFAAAAAVVVLGAWAPPPALASDHFDFHRTQCARADLALAAVLKSCNRVVQSVHFTQAAKAVAHYNMGVAYGVAGQLERAVASYGRALAIDPKDADAAFNRDLAERMLKDAKDKGKEKAADEPQEESKGAFKGAREIARTDLSEDHRRNTTGAPVAQTKAARTLNADRIKTERVKAKRTKANPKKVR